MEQLLRTTTQNRSVSIGLPAARGIMEHRFPLTPEGAAMLVDRGFKVMMESGAAAHIHYPDSAYSRAGVEICERDEALGADITVSLSRLSARDISKMKRGSILLSFLTAEEDDAPALNAIIERHIIALALENYTDTAGNHPFADILHEIDGRAAISIASSLLADAIHGKGILLGGVPGVVPCEVLVIGSDIAACAAASAAIGLGAQVRIFDNNIYRLRDALRQLGPGAIGSAMHPKVFRSALRSADIVVATDAESGCGRIDSDLVDTMKRGVITFDLTSHPGNSFPSMRLIDLDLASAADNDMEQPSRVCYINAGNAVPRTVAMAMSNTLTAMLDDIMVCDGVANALKLNPGLRAAAYTFLGKCVNPEVASILGVRHVDINLFLQFS